MLHMLLTSSYSLGQPAQAGRDKSQVVTKGSPSSLVPKVVPSYCKLDYQESDWFIIKAIATVWA